MFPYHRLQEILIYLHQKKTYVPLQELVNVFHISERTLRSDIQNMNAVLIQNGAYVERIRKKGFYIELSDSNLFDVFLHNISKKSGQEDLDNAQKRIRFLLQILLLEDAYQTQDKLSDMLYVSKNTLLNYIKTIRIMIEQYDLQLTSKINLGIRIDGPEEYKRACFMEMVIPHDIQSMVTDFSNEIKNIFQGIDLHKIERIVLTYAKDHDVRFSDFNLRNMILHFALLISRLQSEKPIVSCQILDENDYDIKPLIHEIESAFHLKVPEGELHYLYSHFMSNANTKYKFEENERYLENMVDRLLIHIKLNYSFDLCRDLLLRDDLIQHFQSILNTKRYHLNKRNPLLNTIKTNYPLAFDITLTSITQLLEHEPYQLTEDEIGYVSLHIGAAIERCFNAQISKKSIIIVCGSGSATSRMLEAKINNLFHDKINIMGRYSYHEYQQMQLQHIDFVVSTIPIEVKDIPVVHVDFSLYNKDVENITKALAINHARDTKSIDDFFEPSLFYYFDQPMQKDEVLHTLCEALKHHHYVHDDYEPSVLERESIADTNMDEILAIPHPMTLCATQTKVTVALCKEPIAWNQKASIRLVLLLAIKKDDHDNIEHLYDTFIRIMNHTQLQNLILKCTSYQDFMKVLHTFQHESVI